MLAGKRLFEGETVSDTLAAVLRQEIDWTALPAETPAAIRHLLRRCLARSPKNRLRDIGDARLVLDEVVAGRPEENVGAEASPVIPQHASRRRGATGLAGGAPPARRGPRGGRDEPAPAFAAAPRGRARCASS